MKKFFSVLLICLLLFSCVGVSAIEDMYVIGQKPITVTYNGDAVVFPDALPLIQNGRTLVPVRAIMERSGLTVGFDEGTRGVSGTKDGFSVSMQIDNANASVTKDGVTKSIILDEPARLIDGRTYVPIRFIAESMDLKVNWNPTYREVVIIDTKEWRQAVAEKSKYLDIAFSTPVSEQKPYAGNFSGNCQLGYYVDSDLTLELNLDVTGTEVFDGKNSGAYILLETDLSSLKNLFQNITEEDDILKQFAKKYRFDLDIITDGNGNTYLKSEGIKSLLQDLGLSGISDKVKDHYVLIPTSKPYLDSALDSSATGSSASTSWDLFCSWVNDDDLLYTQSVLTIGKTLALFADLFSDECLTVTEKKDGSEIWRYQIQNDFAEIVLELYKISCEANGSPMSPEEIAEVKEIFDAMELKLTMEMTIKNDIVQKSEYIYSIDTGNIEVGNTTNPDSPEDTSSTRITFSMNFGSSNREFNSRQDKKISIPSKTIPLEELGLYYE